jgi:hypothetical protein
LFPFDLASIVPVQEKVVIPAEFADRNILQGWGLFTLE